MVLGAFADLGVDMGLVKGELCKIPLTGFDITVNTVCRSGITAKDLHVNLIGGEAPSRNYAQIKSLIKKSGLSPFVKGAGLGIFEKIAKAEAKIHDTPLEKVHFHEVGGVDSLVDILGAAISMEFLSIKKVISSKIPLGTGFVSCSHGNLPVPAPATLSILKGAPVYGTQIPHELTTPTGAAIISFFADSFGPIPDMLINKIGYGAGKREHETRPNILRIITGSAALNSGYCQDDEVVVLETIIDDMNPEIYGFLMERLFEAGALDVVWIPAFMKKNRPGTIVQVLCPMELQEAITALILTETTSSGLRHYTVGRKKLPRKMLKIDTQFGKVEVKAMVDPKGVVQIVPEYEVCKKIAKKKNVPIKTVYAIITGSTFESNIS